VAGGLCLVGALVGLLLSRAALGAHPELMESGWALTPMFLAMPLASIGGTLILIGFFRRAALRAAARDGEPPQSP
jgi:hypothetical protein